MTSRLLIWGLVFSAVSFAQDVPVIKANVRQVLVPVAVTGAKGRPVRDLKQSDFKVFEDGVTEEIAAFSATTDSSVAPPEEVALGSAAGNLQPSRRSAADPARTYLLCVDTLHCSVPSLNRIRDAITKVLRQEQGADSQYALMTLGREVRVLRDSTRDASAISAAAHSREFQKAFQDSEAASTGIAKQQFTELMRSYCSVCPCYSNNGGRGTQCPSFEGRVQAALLSFDERMYGLNQSFLMKLKELVTATATIPTARTVVFISDGFNRFPGRELYSILEGFAPKDRVFASHSRDTQPELESILKLATGYNVRFYTVDSRGIYSARFGAGSTFDAGTAFSTPVQMDSRNQPSESTPTSEAVDRGAVWVARENSDVMAELAHETGGLFFQNSNDLGKGLSRAFADSREFYLLAYVSKNEIWDGKYRKITVAVNDKKLRVNAKAGYWATEK
jgi:VWFA-related protein